MTPLDKLDFTDKQEVFDFISNHLLTQMKKSRGPIEEDDEEATCLYRGPNGLKCAIGCLIKDKQYKETMEGETVDRLTKAVPALKKADSDLLNDLQRIHDDYIPSMWKRHLSKLAHKNKLTFSPPAKKTNK